MAKRQLTDKQRVFLEHLFSDECKGDFRAAMDAAGYARSASANELARTLSEEIESRARSVLGATAPKAAFTFGDVIDNPTDMGNKEKMAAAREVLDRVGIVKEDKLNLGGENKGFVFILPAKATHPDDNSENDEEA